MRSVNSFDSSAKTAKMDVRKFPYQVPGSGKWTVLISTGCTRTVLLFLQFLELPEITRKLQKEMEILVKTSKFLHIQDVCHIHDVAYMNGRRLYGTRNLRTLTGIPGVLTKISISF